VTGRDRCHEHQVSTATGRWHRTLGAPQLSDSCAGSGVVGPGL